MKAAWLWLTIAAHTGLVCAPSSFAQARESLYGFADTHAHFVTHVAHGAKSVFGKPFDERGLAGAMGSCAAVHGPGGFLPSAEIGHRTGGYPEFDGWPKFTTLTHHQAYIDWIERAYQGGLRLVVMLVSNNELLGRFLGSTRPYDDRTVVDASLAEMSRMIDFVDARSGGRGKGFLQIARTPREARRLVAANKLAVVLGIEVDSLGNWRKVEDLPADLGAARARIREYLAQLHRQGVRHIFPVHLSNNALGGTATWTVGDFVTFLLSGRFIELVEAPRGVRYRLDADAFLPGWLKTAMWPLLQGASHGQWQKHLAAQKGIRGGHANALGLTVFGKIVVEEMMKLGMLIDIDHMSARARADTFALAEARHYPLVSGHTSFQELELDTGETSSAGFHEGALTASDIERIRRLGGLVSPGLNQGPLKTAPGSHVENDCDGSSKSFAQAYLFAVKRMRGAAVSLGSDVNGWAEAPNPRFGTKACWANEGDARRRTLRRAQAARQHSGVRYASRIVDYRAHRFEAGKNDSAVTPTERDAWEALAIAESGRDPRRDRIDSPGLLHRLPADQARIENFAIGFLASSAGELRCRGILPGRCPHDRRAAWYAKAGRVPGANEHGRVRALYPALRRVWILWRAMEGRNAPLTRNRAGRRDFDINLDGVAHYGLLPDFLEDLRNVGLTETDLAPLLRSAEAYIEVWERAATRANAP